MGRPCGKNGAANTGTDYVNVGRKNGQQENWATGRPDGQEQQEDIGHEQPKTGANGVDTRNIRKNATSLGVAQLAIKFLSSPRFHQGAVAHMGFIRVICLFIYLFVLYLFICAFRTKYRYTPAGNILSVWFLKKTVA